MLIAKEDILKFIPQRAPFVMVDSLVAADDEGFRSRFIVNANNPLLLENGKLSESAMVENVAQTCAAGFGSRNQGEGGEPKIGFIGAVSRLETFVLPETGAQLETEVKILSAFDSIHLVEGLVTCDGEKLLQCQMKIVLA